MRISELSDVSGISVATIKYYIREGILAPGSPPAPNGPTTATSTWLGCDCSVR
ncbi:MerR family DNA-binding transcriptional regulator [Rathayibacter oskolensis]|uniref:MerR family DNA-binding transcriptional regulator n=1 Tax=Rathayibacter oskolensis TaxID=1891671 RepID=UPI00265FBB10|nr:MerR family DNA-binding transcriptional regulator [Rathayibacter oskolensis]WKK71495.1 MerR family DNA-binding transcriptional regulator [Rathayibacter oskolensis]